MLKNKKIKRNYDSYLNREKIVIQTKYKVISDETANHLTSKEKIKKEKLYRYYTCDYCNEEIKITPKIDEQLGGIVILPRSLTKRDPIKLCLCNKCLNPVIAEFEEVQQ